MPPKLKVVKSQETEEEKQAREMITEIATNIANLSNQVESLLNGRLNKKAIIILLANSTKMPQYQVENMLEALANLGKTYLK